MTDVTDLITKIKKEYGDDSHLIAADKKLHAEVIPTGALTLDLALHTGGIPRGRITEVFGNEASGKTTLCLHLLANAQKLKSGEVAYLNAEYGFDPYYANVCGVDLDSLHLIEVESGEKYLNIAEDLIRSKKFSLIIIDSVASLLPTAESVGEVGDAHVALLPRLISQFFRKNVYAIGYTGTAFVLVNQVREDIGKFAPIGTPETTPGGRAMRHYTSIRLQLRAGEWLGPKSEPTGRKVKARVMKSKVGPALAQAEFDIYYNMGIDIIGSVVDAGVKTGFIRQAGSYYTVEDEKFHGKEALKDYLRKKSRWSKLEKEIKDAFKE